MALDPTKSNDGGVTKRVSVARRLIIDLLHFARRVPSLPVERTMELGDLRKLRAKFLERPCWTALFIRAFGLLAVEFPALRTSYLGWPYTRFFEHNRSVASVTIEKEVEGQPAILFLKIRNPEHLTISKIEERIFEAKSMPATHFAHFRLALGVSKLPKFVRRLVWWFALDWSGKVRARKFGTFGFSTYVGHGAEALHPISPLTATLNIGPMSPTGTIRVRIIYDHRVCDGSLVARALERLEEILKKEIFFELDQMNFETGFEKKVMRPLNAKVASKELT